MQMKNPLDPLLLKLCKDYRNDAGLSTMLQDLFKVSCRPAAARRSGRRAVTWQNHPTSRVEMPQCKAAAWGLMNRADRSWTATDLAGSRRRSFRRQSRSWCVSGL